MKLLILLLIFSIPFFSFSQLSNPVIKWKAQEISKDNNLQGMSIHDENTAVIAGLGKTFKITTDKGVSWNDVGLLNPKYHYNDISITDNVGYIAGRKTMLIKNPTGGEEDVFVNGVLLKTSDNGATWSQLDLSKIGEGTSTAINPNAKGSISLNPYTVLSISITRAMVFMHWFDVLSGTKKAHSAVFKTIDGGAKWTAITPDLGGAYVNAMKKFGSDIYIGGNKILLKASSGNDVVTDLFPAFSLVAGSTAFINEIRSFKENEIHVVTSAGVYTSADGGTTFSKLNGPTGGNDIFKLDDKTMIVLGASSASKATIDGGTTWISCYTGKTSWDIPGVFNDSLHVMATSVVYKMAVSDLKAGNYKWVSKTLVEGSSILQKMYLLDGKNALVVGDDEVAKRTTDGGITWLDAAFPKLVVYDGKYDFRSVSSSGGAGYVTSRWVKLIDYPSGEDYFLNGLIYKTEDAWKTWKVLNTKNVGKDTPTDAAKNPTMKGCYAMDNYTIECVDAKTAFMYVGWSDTITVPKTVTKHSRVFKTTDGGDLWTPVSKDFGGAIINSIKFSGEIGYLAGNKILLKTTDGGKTFDDLYPKLTIGTDSNLVVSSVALHAKDEVYIQTSNNKGVFFTSDGGNTFSKLNGVAGGLDFVVLDNNSFMSLGSSTANKFTNDGGTDWKDCNLGVAIYAAGKILNDSLYVLGKSNVYKVAVSDLDIKTFVAEIKSPNPLKVLYGPTALELASAGRNIDRCMVYNISGQLMAITEPRAQNCRFEYNSFTPGIYIVAALIEGKKYTQKVIFK
ncbi:MAG: YCF48-related protein [Bacteroidota bacterium]|nr:YCF48-related protein [Bacteroidota bacterium]